jgi:hypothetical protein
VGKGKGGEGELDCTWLRQDIKDLDKTTTFEIITNNTGKL